MAKDSTIPYTDFKVLFMDEVNILTSIYPLDGHPTIGPMVSFHADDQDRWLNGSSYLVMGQGIGVYFS